MLEKCISKAVMGLWRNGSRASLRNLCLRDVWVRVPPGLRLRVRWKADLCSSVILTSLNGYGSVAKWYTREI